MNLPALKIFSLLSLSLFIQSIGFAATFGDFTYTSNGSVITITDYPTSATGVVTVPDTIEGLPVTTIGSSAFKGCESMTSIVIPDSVTAIESQAFANCELLDSVDLGEGVTSLDYQAFGECPALTTIHFPASLTSINYPLSGSYQLASISVDAANTAFEVVNGILYSEDMTSLMYCPPGLSLGDFVIPSSVTTLIASAFSNCTGLTSVNVPVTTESIGNNAFFGCTNLTSFIFDENDTSLTFGSSVFRDSGLTEVNLPDHITVIPSSTYQGCPLISVTMPDQITRIKGGAFYGCSSLISVDLNNVVSVEDEAFKNCSSLASVTAPELTSIEDDGFYQTGLVSISFPKLLSVGSRAFYNCGNLLSATFPELVSIDKAAFNYCSALESISFPKVETIGSESFADCYSLNNVVLPGSLTSLGAWAFSECDSLLNVTIEEGLSEIRDYTFYSSALTSITLPSTITSIGEAAFHNCSDLEEIIFKGDPPSIGVEAFHRIGDAPVVYYTLTSAAFTSALTSTYLDMTAIPSESFEEAMEEPLAAERILGQEDVTDSPASYGLYTSDSIQDLSLGNLMVEAADNSFTFSYEVQVSEDLTTWTQHSTPSITVTPAPDKQFLRIAIDE
ncbi:leucine-rich repeat domain-containing protein [Coraliomargarita sp. W4R53]